MEPWPRKNLSGEVAKLQVSGTASTATSQVPGGDGDEQQPKKKKVVPMSKQLSSKIQGCSQRLTEIMSWNSKLDSSTLKLVCFMIELFSACLN